MFGKKLISLTLVFILIFLTVPNITTASTNPKLIKKVYLHADGENPLETKTISRVNKGEVFNLYFAIDDPNEGAYESRPLSELPDVQDKINTAADNAITDTYAEAAEKADELGITGQEKEDYIEDYAEKNLQNNVSIAKLRAEQVARHLEPHYDLNGFSVKIYFDSEYFEYVPDPDKTYQGVIDYTVPNGMIIGSTEDEDIGIEVPDVFNSTGYQVREFSESIETDTSSGLSYALVHVYYSGTFLEQEKDPDRWYNLCAISLRAKKTGNSRVHIGTGTDYGVNLYAKHTDAPDFQPLFDQSAENGGYHTIQVVDQTNPLPPVASPESGSYSAPQEITLTSPTENCDIYYSVNGGSFGLYTGPFTVSQTSEVVAYTQKQKDENAKSSRATFTYRIIPQKPLLYKDEGGNKELITDPYYLYDPFTVYADNKYPYDNSNFDDSTYLYYTYSDIHPEEFNGGGSNPDEEWVQLNKQMGQSIDVNRTGKVRLIAVKETVSGKEVSEVAVYLLGIMPAPVEAEPGAGKHTGPLDVSLTTETDEAEIYFTLDGTDPRESGIMYMPGAVILNSSQTVRAVAKKDGVYSEVTDFYYNIVNPDESRIYAVSPSGKYVGSTTVSLVSEAGGDIEYSTDGGDTWEEYTGIIAVDEDTEILARTSDDGNVYSFTYDITPAAPVFTPDGTTFSQTGKVTVWSPETTAKNTEDYTLYYTTDGTDPRTNGKKAPEAPDAVTLTVTDKTEIRAAVKKGDEWSEVVSNTYEVFPLRPASPDVTLKPSVYEISPDGDELFTQFLGENENNIEIYYTVTYGDVPTPDPEPGKKGTHLYDPDSDEIALRGRTVINAIAVDTTNNTVSEVAVFEYIVVPFTPVARVKDGTLDTGDVLIPVITPEGSEFTYSINGNGAITVENVPSEVYIDLKTGNIYEKTSDDEYELLLDSEINQNNSGDITLKVSCELDGQKSGTNTYTYTADAAELSMPFADLESGVYTEEKRVGNLYHEITLTSSNPDGTVIEYKINNGEWQEYDDSKKIPLENVDTVLYARAKSGSNTSEIAEYVYEFVPPAPVISPVSGTYPAGELITVSLRENLPTLPDGKTYSLYLRKDNSGDIRVPDGVTYTLSGTVAYKAYVINNFSGKQSENTFRYYAVDSSVSGGSIYTVAPYDVLPGDTKIISKDALNDDPYNEGIHLRTREPGTVIKYSYVITKGGKETNPTDFVTYDDSNPIIVSSAMDKIEITAKLVDYSGNEIDGSECVFTYEFIGLEVPRTDLYIADPAKIEYPKNTEFVFVNDYAGKPEISVYYTTNSKIKTPDKDNSELYIWDTPVKISKDMTVKAVYYMACQSEKCDYCKAGEYAECENGIYSATGKYPYTVKSAGSMNSSSSGGGRVVDNTRRYTKDIFGNEHPTHISYINGYPDGSVQPSGNITREEMAAILYRITNHEYEEPFVVTGNVFPDVKQDRWSVLNIEYLAGKNVILGYPDGEYKPEGNLTRAEFAALIVRFASLESKKNTNPYSDLKTEHWAYNNIVALYESGFMTGYEDGTFRPDSKITRAEVMKVVNLLLGRNPSEPYVKSLKINPYNDLDESKWYYVDVIEATITHNYYLDSKDVEIKWEDIK